MITGFSAGSCFLAGTGVVNRSPDGADVNRSIRQIGPDVDVRARRRGDACRLTRWIGVAEVEEG